MTDEEKKTFDTMKEVINQHSKTLKQLVKIIGELQAENTILKFDIKAIRCKIDSMSRSSDQSTMDLFNDILSGKKK